MAVHRYVARYEHHVDEGKSLHRLGPGGHDIVATDDVLHAFDNAEIPHRVLGPGSLPGVGIAAIDGVGVAIEQLANGEAIFDRSGKRHGSPPEP